jgi:hypothetical protein
MKYFTYLCISNYTAEQRRVNCIPTKSLKFITQGRSNAHYCHVVVVVVGGVFVFFLALFLLPRSPLLFFFVVAVNFNGDE